MILYKIFTYNLYTKLNGLSFYNPERFGNSLFYSLLLVKAIIILLVSNLFDLKFLLELETDDYLLIQTAITAIWMFIEYWFVFHNNQWENWLVQIENSNSPSIRIYSVIVWGALLAFVLTLILLPMLS